MACSKLVCVQALAICTCDQAGPSSLDRHHMGVPHNYGYHFQGPHSEQGLQYIGVYIGVPYFGQLPHVRATCCKYLKHAAVKLRNLLDHVGKNGRQCPLPMNCWHLAKIVYQAPLFSLFIEARHPENNDRENVNTKL